MRAILRGSRSSVDSTPCDGSVTPATGDGSNKTFTLAGANVIADSMHGFVNGVLWDAELSAGTGSGGVDQIVFQTAPTSAATVKVDYSYHATSADVTGACVLMLDVVTTAASPQQTMDAARDGSVDSTMVVDSAGTVVDKWFKAALPRMSFD